MCLVKVTLSDFLLYSTVSIKDVHSSIMQAPFYVDVVVPTTFDKNVAITRYVSNV